MPEEVTITSAQLTAELSQPNFPTVRVRSSWLRLLTWGLLGVAILTIAVYALLAQQTGAWQFLAGIGVFILGILFVLLGHYLIKQGKFNAAGYSVMLAIAIAYGAGELLFFGLTPYLAIGGALVMVLTGSLLLPGQWKKTLVAVAVYLAYLWLAHNATIQLRYDVSDLLILNVSVASATIALALIIFWLFIRSYATYALRTKLLIAFLVVSLVSMGVVTFYVDRTLRTTLQERAAAQLINVAQVRGTSVGDLLAEEAKLLQTLALGEKIRSEAETSNTSYQGNDADIQAALLQLDETWQAAVAANNNTDPLLQAKLDNPIAKYLQEYRTLYPENVELFVTDLRGALLGATNRTSDYYQADEDWWQAAYNKGTGAIYYSQPDYDESSNTFSINIALPIYDQSGTNMVGILRTTVDLAAQEAIVARAQFAETSLLFPRGERITDQGPTSVPSDVLAQLPANADTIAEMEWEGQPSFVAVAPVSASDPKLGVSINQLRWKVIAPQSRAEVLAPVEAQTTTVLLFIGVIAIVIVGASIGLSQVLVRPITNLTTIAKRVAEGDLAARAAVETNDEIGTLAVTFNSMTAQLSSLVSSLEERVQARTEQLRTSAAVGQAAASVLDPNQLLREAVNLIADRFGFYYAAVFTLDETGRYAVLREGTGEAGHTLKERGHQLEVGGQSMVGSVTAQRKARIALDVGTEAVRFANPLLPDTRSEIALPLIVGNRVLGALDVQATQAAAFDEADAVVLQSLADQIAIALNNAEQFSDAEHQAQFQIGLTQLTRDLFSAASVEELYRSLGNDLKALVPHAYLGLALAQTTTTALREYRLQTQSDPVLVEGAVWPAASTLSGRAFTTHQPTVSHHLDQNTNEGDAAQLAQAGFRSVLCLPLIVGERVLGTLNFASVEPQAYSLENSAQLEQIAGQVAVALENQRLVQAQQRSLQEMEALTRQLTGQAWSKQWQRLGKQAESIHYVRSGITADLPASTPEIEAAIAQRVPIARTEHDQAENASPYQAALAVPIVLRGEVLGGLQVSESHQAREWTADDITFIQAVADQVALALDNARLLEETEKRAERERTINRITSRIRNAPSINQMLAVAAQELRAETRAARSIAEIAPEAEGPAGNGQSAHGQEDERS